MPESPYPLLSVDDARHVVLAHAPRVTAVHLRLGQLPGRILAEDIVARAAIPPFAAAAKDGYAVVAAGGAQKVNGFQVLPLQKAIDEKLLYFVPEPKSPHGSDVTPNGKYIVVAFMGLSIE